MQQQGIVFWLTGISGSGKSTLATELEKKIFAQGMMATILDGDNIRHHLNSDLGFTDADRDENVRRIAEVAKLFKEAGMITIVACISPRAAMRQSAKKTIGEEAFLEVYVKADAETCQRRDPKGNYAKALKGEIKNYTGVSSSYEEPDTPEVVIDTTQVDVLEAINIIWRCYEQKKSTL